MRATIESLRDQLHKEEVETQKRQVSQLSQQVKDLGDKIDNIQNAPARGKSELDILSELTKEGIDLLKSELPSVRGDIRSAIGSIELPAKKSAQDRAERVGRYKKSLKSDEELIEVGKRLFLSE